MFTYTDLADSKLSTNTNRYSPRHSVFNPPLDSTYNPPLDSVNPPLDSVINPPLDSVVNPPLNSAYNPPLNYAYNPPLDSAYNTPLNSAYNTPLNSAYNPPLDSAYNPTLDSAYNPPLDSASNPPLNSAYNPPLNSTYNPPLNYAYNPPLNYDYNPSLDPAYNRPLDSVYNHIGDSVYNHTGDSAFDAPNNAPGNHAPGNNVPGNNAPGNNAPGNNALVPRPHQHFLLNHSINGMLAQSFDRLTKLTETIHHGQQDLKNEIGNIKAEIDYLKFSGNGYSNNNIRLSNRYNTRSNTSMTTPNLSTPKEFFMWLLVNGTVTSLGVLMLGVTKLQTYDYIVINIMALEKLFPDTNIAGHLVNLSGEHGWDDYTDEEFVCAFNNLDKVFSMKHVNSRRISYIRMIYAKRYKLYDYETFFTHVDMLLSINGGIYCDNYDFDGMKHILKRSPYNNSVEYINKPMQKCDLKLMEHPDTWVILHKKCSEILLKNGMITKDQYSQISRTGDLRLTTYRHVYV